MNETIKPIARNKRNPFEKPRVPTFLAASALAGVLLTAVFYLLVVHVLCRGTYVEMIFTQRGFIPYLTTYLGFMAFVQLTGFLFHIRREAKNLLAISGILGHVPAIDLEEAAKLQRQIDEKIGASTIGLVINRVRRSLYRIENRGSASEVAGLLTEQAEIDRAILSNSYAVVKFIAWLLPVLGFIATVGGIGQSMAHFRALFEQKGTEHLQTLLGPITSNLGVAFDTTLLALITVALVMFVLHAVQKRGTELLNNFDEFCLDKIAAKVRGGGIPEESLPEQYRDVVRALSVHAENMEQKFEQAVNRVVDKLVENEQQRWQSFTDSFRAASREHQQAILAACETVTRRSAELAEELRNWEPQFRESLKAMIGEIRDLEGQRIKSIADTLETAGGRIGNALTKTAEQSSAACDRMAAAQERAGTYFSDTVNKLEELLKKNAAEFRQMESQQVGEIGRLLESTATRVGGALAKTAEQASATCDRMVAAQDKAGAELRGALAQLEALLRTGEELATIQQTLHSNLAALTQTSQMSQTVERLNGSIDKLAPVLAELQKRRRMQVRILDEVEDDGRQTS